jgi:hypothetical protein
MIIFAAYFIADKNRNIRKLSEKRSDPEKT